MAEETKVEVKVEPTPEIKPEGKTEPDLITRASQVKIEPIEEKFDVTDIEKIKDPEAKTYAEKAYKSFQKDYTKKSQELAELRKSYEARKQERWTTDRIQKELLSDPTFVQEAQKLATVQPEESMLTETDRRLIEEARNSALVAQQEAFKQQRVVQDEKLKARYANYNSEAVDIITNDLLEGKVRATREDLWKVYDYEQAVRRAYELGRQDSKGDLQEKIKSNSLVGVTAVSNSGIEPEKGESSLSYWNRIALSNLAKVQQSKDVRK